MNWPNTWNDCLPQIELLILHGSIHDPTCPHARTVWKKGKKLSQAPDRMADDLVNMPEPELKPEVVGTKDHNLISKTCFWNLSTPHGIYKKNI